jgi:DNA-binding transcriptional LysR family regulator
MSSGAMSNPLEHTNFLSLRLFLAIVEKGSIAEAARHAFIAPTAVTKRIQELEQGLGVSLFVRSSKGVLPTDAGRALAKHVRAMEDLLERMQTEMKDYAEGARGHVRLIANASALVEFLADEVAAFAAQYPDIRVDIEEAHSEDVVRSVRDGNADFGVFAPPVTPGSGVVCYPYRGDVLAVAVPSDHALATREAVGAAELRNLPLIGVHGSSSLAMLISQALGSSRSLRVASNDVARWLVSKRLGVTILPAGLIGPFEAALGIKGVPIDEPWARRSLQLCVRADDTLSVAARALLAALRAEEGRGAAAAAATAGPAADPPPGAAAPSR